MVSVLLDCLQCKERKSTDKLSVATWVPSDRWTAIWERFAFTLNEGVFFCPKSWYGSHSSTVSYTSRVQQLPYIWPPCLGLHACWPKVAKTEGRTYAQVFYPLHNFSTQDKYWRPFKSDYVSESRIGLAKAVQISKSVLSVFLYRPSRNAWQPHKCPC